MAPHLVADVQAWLIESLIQYRRAAEATAEHPALARLLRPERRATIPSDTPGIEDYDAGYAAGRAHAANGIEWDMRCHGYIDGYLDGISAERRDRDSAVRHVPEHHA